MIVACVRGDRAENAKLVARDPKRFCAPAYIGPRGWLGVRLDAGRVDWKELARRVEASYREVAPKRLALRERAPPRAARERDRHRSGSNCALRSPAKRIDPTWVSLLSRSTQISPPMSLQRRQKA